MSVTTHPLTYDDLFDMPDDGLRRELIGGELVVSPAPRRTHQDVSANIHLMLQLFLRDTGSGKAWAHPVDIYVDKSNVVQPDLIVIRQSRLEIYRPEGVVVEPPDIIVEIISPSSRRIDRVGKMALYARFRVPEYWIVDPEERTLSLHALEGNAYVSVEPDAEERVCSRVFPDLRVDPAEVFANID